MTNSVEDLAALIQSMQVTDLSPLIENGMPRWLTHPHAIVHQTVTHDHDGYYTQTLNIAEHTGSHIDAPAHIHPNMMDKSIDKAPPAHFLAQATLFDLRPFDLQPGQLGTVEMLEQCESKMSRPLSSGDIMLANFGWHERYWVTDKNWRFYSANCPGLTDGAVEWIANRNPIAVGADTVAFDTALLDGKEVQPSSAHLSHCLPREIYIIECLANLGALPSTFFFMSLPLKIKYGSGSPVRAIALH